MQPIELTNRKPSAALVAALAVAAAVVASVWAVIQARQAPAAIAPPATSATATTSPGLYVHVAGAVREPGLYEVPAGSRVADAIELAGGALRRADLDALNLAQAVTDGMRIFVPGRGATPGSRSTASPGAPSLISVNTADVAALETVPGLGPVKAAAIVAFRDEVGGFESLEQLLEVSGIGPATFEMIAPHLTL